MFANTKQTRKYTNTLSLQNKRLQTRHVYKTKVYKQIVFKTKQNKIKGLQTVMF